MPTPIVMPSRKGKGRLVVLLIILFVLIAGGGVAAWYYLTQSKTEPTKTATTNNTETTKLDKRQPCFVRAAHIVCVDSDGKNRKRFDLPVLKDGSTVKSLYPTPDQKKYAAVYGLENKSSVWILNDKLEAEKELKLDESFKSFRPSVAIAKDGKTVVLGLTKSGTPGVTTDLYRYDLATDKLTQLTNTGSSLDIAVLSDGRILYTGAGGVLYVMKPDGTDPKQLSIAPLQAAVGGHEFSYDAAVDKLLVFGFDAKQKSALGITDITGLLAGKPLNAVTIDPLQYFSGFYVDSDSVMAFIGAKANIIDLQGKVKTEISLVGEPIGMLDTSGFKASEVQAEKVSELIPGYGKAPADFQAFIAKKYNDENPGCVKASAGEFEYSIIVYKVVRDTFVQTGEACSDGGRIHYKKVNGEWVDTKLGGQSTSDCKAVNAIAYTKEIITECLDGAKNIANTNP